MANMTAQELHRIQEQLRMEGWMVKKYQFYSQSVDDPQLQTKFQQIAACHQNHYNKLTGQLG